MLFNSWTFLVFLLLTFGAYHFLPWPGRWRMACQIGLLTVASYVFYAWHTPWLVVILAASTWINAFVTLKLVKPGTNPRTRKRWLTFAILSNLGVLAFFKYASLIVRSFLPNSWWSHWGFDLTQIPLPVGISFFTFQGISLVVDIYRSGGKGIEGLRPPESRSESGWLMMRMAFFKAFFPQLVAGPIVKAHEFMHQIAAKSLASVDWDDAAKKLILGFFLKMVVADNLREATAGLSYPAFVGMPGINLLFLLYGFSFQIFADFAGYSLIAMGLARLFGYQLPINFNFPYLSQSITEFWRRWHVSLSSWLREYLYYPLGGNRKGAARTYANLIIVMLLGGLWHGAAWSYMVWGGAHGVFLALERFLGVKGGVGAGDSDNRGRKSDTEGRRSPISDLPPSLPLMSPDGPSSGQSIRAVPTATYSDLPSPISHLRSPISDLRSPISHLPSPISYLLRIFRIFLTFNLVSFLWLLFQLPKFDEAVLYLREMAAWKSGFIPQPIFSIVLFSSPVVLYHLWAAIRPVVWNGFQNENPGLANMLANTAYAVLLFLIVTNSGNAGAFIYFQF